MLKNKKAQLELDEPAVWLGLVFGLVGAMLGVLITAKMGGSGIMKLIDAVVIGIVCFFVGWKIMDSG